MGVHDYWVVLFLVGFCFQARVLSAQNLTCHPDDLNALKDFMNGLQSVIDGWNVSSTDCCEWTGITCNSSQSLGLSKSVDTNRVVGLVLPYKRLVGRVSESLGNLEELKTLNLSHNFLKNSLPVSVFKLPNLEYLDLLSNDFSGNIPVDINLPSIKYLDLSQNFLNGSIPHSICANSTQLVSLKLSVNYLSGDLPSEIGNCSSLIELCLPTNNLSGGIPESVFQLKELARLIIQENKLSGSLSNQVGNLINLVRLDISTNGFSGPIPDVFDSLVKLQFFVAHSNDFSGQLPTSLSSSPTITLLNVRNNSLEGPILINCSEMISLTSLDVGSNHFHGPIPSNLPSCKHLNNINLARNNLTGQIPETFRNFHTLSYLSLSNSTGRISNLSSALQILQQCQNLTTLVLTMNFNDDALPSDPTIHFKKLKILIIANSRLTGSIPQWLRNSTRLQLLDLSWNCLEGTVPVWFGNFSHLFYLDISNNSFTGEIPRSITGLRSLITGNISLIEPSPDFPLFQKKNASARGLQYNKVWGFPPTLALGNNNLSGPIWPEFGNLKSLHVLDLKSNNLSGEIPSELSGMTSLETLDLSHNKLSGTIPASLVLLSFMSKFNVAGNELVGTIPTGGQFGTFPNSSFEGNNLCGYHASPCSVDTPSVQVSKSRKNVGSIIGIAVGTAFGIAILLALLYLIMLRVYSRREVDPEKEDHDLDEIDVEELGSKSVVLFQNKENNKELSLDDLLQSTDNFDQANIIGCGGFGLVYKATLPGGKKVAIKRLSGDCGQMDREFRAEVEALSRAQHPNLVHLQGYCTYKSDRLLIYSYMENSSLDYWLHEKPDGPSFLDWNTRLQIAQGAARGLSYLHQSCEPHIVHRDIKSSNILLDENFTAHLADFGLARLLLPYDTHVTTDLVGTLGYIPPEYGQASVATYKGDVYSFGVVLLELLTGKRPMDVCKPKGSRDLISWVFQMKREKRETEVFDPVIYDKQIDQELLCVFEIALLCLSGSPKVRPSTQQLVSWLDNININIKL